MRFTVEVVLVIAAFLCTIGSATSPPKCPLWIAVLLLCVFALILVLPIK